MVLKINKLIMLLIFVTLLKSCDKDEGIDLPQIGENSFTAKVDGKTFIPEDVKLFTNVDYGIYAYVNKETWHLVFSNSEQKDIHIYIKEVKGPGEYTIGSLDGDLNFYTNTDTESAVAIADGSGSVTGVGYSSKSNFQQIITIARVEDENILIGSFEKLTLVAPNNNSDHKILTDGKFNINISTLNQANNQ